MMSDGSTGKLTDEELTSVNTAIGNVSPDDLSGQWTCADNRSDVATHLLFLGFADNQMKTVASTDDQQLCGLGASEHMTAMHYAFLPVIKAHFPAGSGSGDEGDGSEGGSH